MDAPRGKQKLGRQRLKKDLKIFEKNKKRFHYVIPNEETKEKVTQMIIKSLESHFK